MTEKENKLAAKMLTMASDEFSNHGCNDIDESLFADWTDEEKDQFMIDFHIWNGDPEEIGNMSILMLGDAGIMSFLAHKLRAN